MLEPHFAICFGSVFLAVGSIVPALGQDSEIFRLRSTFSVPRGVAEILDVTEDGRALVYTNSEREELGLVDISDAGEPRALPALEMGGEPTSVSALGRWAVAAVRTTKPRKGEPAPASEPGRLVLVDLADPARARIKGSVPIGFHPDCVKLARLGRALVAVIAIENEPLVVVDGLVIEEEAPGHPGDVSLAGKIQVVTLDVAEPARSRVVDVPLPAARLRGAGLLFPEDPQPEFVAVHGWRAAVSLQENNGMAIIDLLDPGRPRLVEVFSTGIAASRRTDLVEDGEVALTGSYPDDVDPGPTDAGGQPVPAGARFPDAIEFRPDGAWILSADEGELNFTGGRGWSIWSPAGELVWEDGGQLESLAIRRGLFPEKRAENKGIEIEGVTCARFGAEVYAFVLSERGSFMAVYELGRSRPDLKQILRTGEAPEGVVAIPARGLVVTADEVSGTLSIFQRTSKR